MSAGVCLLALLLASAASASHGDEPVYADIGSNPRNLILRLADLSRAYSISGETGLYCDDFFYYLGDGYGDYQADVEHPSNSCEVTFLTEDEFQWGRPDVDSRAVVFERADSATMAFAYSVREAGKSKLSPLRRTPAEPLGDESAFFSTRRGGGRASAEMIWRTGRVLSIVSAGGAVKRWVDRHALRLARVQQDRIVRPTAVTPRDNSRRALPLIDHRLRAPIYWLGRTFESRRLARRLRLRFTAAGEPGHGPGWIATADYGWLSLGTWTPSGWREFRRSPTGRSIFTHHVCRRVTRVPVSGGRALILNWRPDPGRWSGLRGRWRRCGRPWPQRFDTTIAYVRYPGAVVSVNVPQCFRCFWGTGGRDESSEGLRAVVRALRVLTPAQPGR